MSEPIYNPIRAIVEKETAALRSRVAELEAAIRGFREAMGDDDYPACYENPPCVHHALYAVLREEVTR